MFRKPGGSTPAAFAAPSHRRRPAFRAALLAVTLGWVAVIALVVVGLSSAPDPPGTALAGTTSHRSTPSAVHRTSRPAAKEPKAPKTHKTRKTPEARRTSSIRLSESSKQVTHTPAACSAKSKCAGRGCRQSQTALAAVVFGSVQAAFNANGVAPPDDSSAGNFDCRGFSFQTQQLDAAGFAPGDTVAADGQALTLPAVATGAPDEIIADGQVIHLNPAGRRAAELGFLGAGEFGTQAGLVTITYVDGSAQKATLRLADWYADAPAPGSVIAASAPWNVPAARASAYGQGPVSVYYAQIPVDASKRIVSVTLPKNANLHLFDIGVPSAASYPTVSSAYNDTALAPASAPRDGNYDGAGHSYDSGALAAKGLTPGTTVTAQGVRFTWPHYAPGQLDDIRAEGQTIGVTGTGRVLGFLGAAALETQRGTVTIHYTDGSSQSATVSFADWLARRAASGGTVVATAPWSRIPGAGPRQVSIYSATVPLEAGKTIASVTLPVNVNMHVFAIAEGS